MNTETASECCTPLWSTYWTSTDENTSMTTLTYHKCFTHNNTFCTTIQDSQAPQQQARKQTKWVQTTFSPHYSHLLAMPCTCLRPARPLARKFLACLCFCSERGNGAQHANRGTNTQCRASEFWREGNIHTSRLTQKGVRTQTVGSKTSPTSSIICLHKNEYI